MNVGMTPAEFSELRQAIGSPEEVARMMECGREAIWRWENGKRAIQGPIRVLIRILAKQAQDEKEAEAAEVRRLAKLEAKEKLSGR